MKKIKIVLGSPGDVSSERRKVRNSILNNVNLWAKFSGIEFVPIDWEFNTYPSVGKYAQDVINKQFGEDYEVLIAIFWYRVGTPTPNYPSGTVEEIERAISRSLDDRSVNVKMYFKTKEIPESVRKHSQLNELNKLKKEWSNRGVYYSEFKKQSELIELIYRHLALWVEDFYFLGSNSDIDSKNYLEQQSRVQLSAIEYMELFNRESTAHTNMLSEIRSLIEINSDATFAENKKLFEFLELPKSKSARGKITQTLRKSEFRRAKYAKELKQKLTLIKSKFIRSFDLYSAALLAASEGNKSEKKMMRTIAKELPCLIKSNELLLMVIQENIETSKSLIQTLANSDLEKTEQELLKCYLLMKESHEDYIRILNETTEASVKLLKKKGIFGFFRNH